MGQRENEEFCEGKWRRGYEGVMKLAPDKEQNK